MEDIFKPQSLTIGELFGNKDALYQIPRYQRPYSWGDDQLDKLWSDLLDAQENDPNYFLGSVITAKPEEASNYLDIVDGQQRLTTLLIMLCVCRDLFPNINQDILENDPFAIDGKMIKSSIRFNDRFERLRLKTHSNHESDFQQLVLNDGVSINNKRPYKKDLRIEEAPNFKFKNTSAFFTEKFLELGEQSTGRLINYIFNQVKIIRIDCQSVSFAIKLFQVLNDRGLDLSNSDLIKSFLIGRIHKIYDADAELKKTKEDQFMDDWKSCETIAIDTEENMNNLFVMFEYFLLAKNPEKSLYDELVRLFENIDPNEIIIKFKKFITNYKDKVYNTKDPIMYSLFYLRWGMYWRSIVLTALFNNYQDFDKFLKVFRRYYYINWIAGNTLTKIKQTSFNIIGWLKENKSVDFIEEQLHNLMANDTYSRAVSNLNYDIYFEQWCKPLLFMIEYNQIDNPPFYSMGDRNIQTEHILPRAYEKNEDWSFAKQIEGIDEWIHTGANLTLLSGSKNLDARNYKFETKIKSYDGSGLEDAKDSKMSSFNITQRIVNDYNSNKFNKEWNVDSINNRWVWFCQQVESILEIDLSENKNNLLKKGNEK
ncbi:DUF262 domain-containing protein [Chryseobacterium sp. SL1]|uniref:DUF262 domain-containing protein n=1 Tax=Chryseobacterium sp. SL1 TaxID=2995159 RepID=UPI00227541EF|nr:DUF262 domain-containing HNH endonuclease family protein [Chryseobacterium sp. SL1]MCY1660900.1 DUF262 domain-containing HNH endonuclease family protein [Chryseobacterium sp. SL1]